MRYIPIQPDITLHNLEGKVIKDENDEPATLSLKRFVLGRLTDASFATGMDAVMSALQIREAVERADDVIAIETEDWKRLVVATKTPKAGYPPAVAHCMVPLMKAITEATEKPPKKQIDTSPVEKMPAADTKAAE